MAMENKNTLLIVDDEPINIDFIVSNLESDYEVKIAHNGSVALKILEKYPVDLILLDIQMPVMDGYETIKEIKKNPNLQDIPVLFLTAKGDGDSLAYGFELGAKDYITKPFNAKELQARIENHLETYKLQNDLKTQKKEFEAIFLYAQDGIAIVDLEGNFLKFNDAFQKLTGFTQEELYHLNCNDLTASEHKEKNINAMQQVIVTGHVENFEKDCVVKNNKRITVHISISLLPDKNSLLLILKDASSIKLLEEQAKLASMGEMIGNIAHQWRQPLSIITTSASGLKMEMEYGIDVTQQHIAQCTDLVVQQAQYLSKTIDSFRDFLKGDKNYGIINLSKVLQNTFSLVEATLKNNFITLHTNIDQSLHVMGSSNELSEAFINIINNSKDILKEKIDSHFERLVFIEVQSKENRSLEVIFKDNGGGIPENIIDRIFEPYYTSKHQSIGTGVGLSMADKIVRERHNGTIQAYNEEYEYNGIKYKGACFKITLPLA